MWNLLPQGDIGITYRPSAVSGTITNSGYAYDVDSYPWSTAAVAPDKIGSSVANTADTVTVEYNTFGSLAKYSFSTCKIQYVVSAAHAISVSGGTTPFAYPKMGIFIDYQVDGSNWVVATDFNISAAGNYLPGQWATGEAIAQGSSNKTVSKLEGTFLIPSSSFSSNLSDLKIRFRTYTVTFTGSGYYWQNATTYSIWDLRAVIS